MFCPNCGFENQDGTKFCQNCGTQLDKVFVSAQKQEITEEKPEKTPKKKYTKLVVITTISIIIIAITATTLWALNNLVRCSMCGDVVRDYKVHIVGAISTEDGMVRTGGSSQMCESCAPGYGADGLTFYTYIGLEDGEDSEDEDYHSFKWYNEYVEVELKTSKHMSDHASDMSEEEKENYFTECITDMYENDFFEYAEEDYICEHTAYLYRKNGNLIICTRGYDQIYIFNIYSDHEGYLDALEQSILNAEIY